MTADHSASPALALDATQLRTLLDDVGTFIYAKDLHGRYTFANRASLELLALEHVDQIIGKTDSDFFAADTAADIARNDQEAIEQSCTIAREETNQIQGSATVRTFLSIKKPLFDQQGQVCGMYGVSTDITAAKQLEWELRREKEQLRVVLDNLDATVCCISSAGIKRHFPGFMAVVGHIGLASPMAIAAQSCNMSMDLPPPPAQIREPTVCRTSPGRTKSS